MVQAMLNSAGEFARQKAEDRDCSRPSLVMRFGRRHPGAQKGGAANYGGRCSNRTTSKTSIPTLNEQRNLRRALE